MTKNKIIQKYILIIIIAISILPNIEGFPVAPAQFHGDMIINGTYAKVGTKIFIYDNENNKCGSVSITESGKYVISCLGDNPDTPKDEGAKNNEVVTIKTESGKQYKVKWYEGSFTRLDIIINSQNTPMHKKIDSEQPSNENWRAFPVLMTFFIAIIAFIAFQIKKEDKKT